MKVIVSDPISDEGIKIFIENGIEVIDAVGSKICLLYTSPSPRDRSLSRMPSSA